MTTILPITRQQLTAINRSTLKYTLDIAEKGKFFLDPQPSSLLATSPLRANLVFKGGTALHHRHLPQYRFSEDIDFPTLVREGLSVEAVKDVLEQDGLFQVRKQYVSNATIKIERLWYRGILD
jgi:hypothetical protein